MSFLFPPNFQNVHTSILTDLSESFDQDYFLVLYGPRSKNLTLTHQLLDGFSLYGDGGLIFVANYEGYVKLMDELKLELNHNLRFGSFIDYEQFCFERKYDFPSNNIGSIQGISLGQNEIHLFLETKDSSCIIRSGFSLSTGRISSIGLLSILSIKNN